MKAGGLMFRLPALGVNGADGYMQPNKCSYNGSGSYDVVPICRSGLSD